MPNLFTQAVCVVHRLLGNGRLAWLAACLVLVSTAGATAPTDGVPPDRLARLSRGVNLSHWIWLPQRKTLEQRAAFITRADIALLKSAGLTHARLPFEPPTVWDHNEHKFKDAGLVELRAAIATVLDGGLAVIVDAHAVEMGWAMPDAAGRCEELERFWAALAGELGATDPERVFLEVLNEPHDIKDPGAWEKAQERVVAVIRAGAPKHTIIVTGDGWGGIDGLKRLKPLADPNLVYSFHFYEPHTFTHQGASWGWKPWRHIKGLVYPSGPEGVEQVAAGIGADDDEKKQAAGAVRQYGKERWDAARIGARLAQAAEWGKANRVPVYCGEFGVFRNFSPRQSRLEWIKDTRTGLEMLGIGWAMWDYCGGFALVDGEPGSRTADEGVLRALDLAVPAPEQPASGAVPGAAATITVDTSETPDLKEWGEKARAVAEAWYPRICEDLASDGFTPPAVVEIVLRKGMKGIAGTSGTTIRVAGAYVSKHEDDLGMIVHELVHVAQAYPRNKAPMGWLVEGIADYERFWKYEPGMAKARIDPTKSSYRDGYRVTATFLAWLVENKDAAIVTKLNAALRKGDCDEAMIKELLGKGVEELWKEFLGTRPK